MNTLAVPNAFEGRLCVGSWMPGMTWTCSLTKWPIVGVLFE